jgi:hypothetical protein
MFLVMRLLHVGLGAFWAGALIFTAFFLFPAMRDAGPDGAKVGAELLRRNFVNIMPIVALITILSGLWLYLRNMGLGPGYAQSRAGMAIGIGAVAAVLAFLLGIGIVRPSILQAARLSQAAASRPGPEQQGALEAARALRARAGKAGVAVALLLAISVMTMAVARYL